MRRAAFKVVATCAGLLLVIGGILARVGLTSDASAGPGRQDGATPTGSRSENQAALEERMRQLEERQGVLGRLILNPRRPGNQTVGAGARSESPQDPRQAKEEWLDARFQQLETVASSEIRDPSWASEAEDAVRAAFAGAGAFPSARLESVRCADSLCRVQVEVDGATGDGAFREGFGRSLRPAFRRVVMRRIDRDGDHFVWLAFAVREGRELPRAPDPGG